MIILGYELYRADHPSNVKRGGICIYYKNLLPLKVTNIQYLQECINFEMKIGDKLCNFVALYRSPSQSQDEFEKFAKNLELNLDTISANNPFLSVTLVILMPSRTSGIKMTKRQMKVPKLTA